ncbi:hypothetical protein G6F31_017582 [Rhizopus arrhizus]|nr:hypothetical protein G6F31_017582 [Rhizopus arrhizus]
MTLSRIFHVERFDGRGIARDPRTRALRVCAAAAGGPGGVHRIFHGRPADAGIAVVCEWHAGHECAGGGRGGGPAVRRRLVVAGVFRRAGRSPWRQARRGGGLRAGCGGRVAVCAGRGDLVAASGGAGPGAWAAWGRRMPAASWPGWAWPSTPRMRWARPPACGCLARPDSRALRGRRS